MKTEVTYRGGSGAQGKMEVVVECDLCKGGTVEIIWGIDWGSRVDKKSFTSHICYVCHGTGRERKE